MRGNPIEQVKQWWLGPHYTPPPNAPLGPHHPGPGAPAPQAGVVVGRDRQTGQLTWYRGNGHLLTIAPARSGKLVSSIGPNVFFHPGSLFAVDPKGEIAHAFHALRENGFGQPTYFLNPTGLLGLPCHGINPLDMLKAGSPTLATDAAMIANILIEREGGANGHWSDEAANLVTGLLLYCAIDAPPAMRSLIGMRMYLALEGKEQNRLFQGMQNSPVAKVAEVAAMIGGKSDNERGSVFSTARRHTHFLSDDAMVAALGKADCDLLDLKRKQISVFVIPPIRYLDAWQKWYRLMVAMAINAMMDQTIPTPPVQALFVLDELYALKRLEAIAIAAGLLPGLGLRLHLVVQSLSQLQSQATYHDIYRDLISNAGVVQAFNVSDAEDARFLQSMMAQRPFGVGAGGVPNYQPMERPDEIMYRDPQRVFVRIQGNAPRWYAKAAYCHHWIEPKPGQRVQVQAAPEITNHPLFGLVDTSKVD